LHVDGQVFSIGIISIETFVLLTDKVVLLGNKDCDTCWSGIKHEAIAIHPMISEYVGVLL
jgi:hypothetical protein